VSFARHAGVVRAACADAKPPAAGRPLRRPAPMGSMNLRQRMSSFCVAATAFGPRPTNFAHGLGARLPKRPTRRSARLLSRSPAPVTRPGSRSSGLVSLLPGVEAGASGVSRTPAWMTRPRLIPSDGATESSSGFEPEHGGHMVTFAYTGRFGRTSCSSSSLAPDLRRRPHSDGETWCLSEQGDDPPLSASHRGKSGVIVTVVHLMAPVSPYRGAFLVPTRRQATGLP
jgi:hypothetical protein